MDGREEEGYLPLPAHVATESWRETSTNIVSFLKDEITVDEFTFRMQGIRMKYFEGMLESLGLTLADLEYPGLSPGK